MKTPTFREQYDKLVKAYMNNEVEAVDCERCFVGNLLGGDGWTRIRDLKFTGRGTRWEIMPHYDGFEEARNWIFNASNGLYSPQEIVDLENAFMDSLSDVEGKENAMPEEERMYLKFEKALLKLRQIHESKGEVIEDYVFQKRELVKA